MTAGLGTRLQPFTNTLPKALLPLVGVPMAQYALDALTEAGVTRIIANIHHLGAKTSEGLRALDLHCAALEFSDERELLLGSGGGVRKALARFGSEPFFYFNADVVCGIDLARLARHHARMRAQWGAKLTLAVCPRAPTSAGYREVLLDPASHLVTGLGSVVSDKPFFMSVAVIEPDAFAGAPVSGEFGLVEEVFLPAIAERKCAAYLVDDPRERLWFDVGSPELWLSAHASLIELLERGTAPPLLRRRIEAESLRVGERIWASRRSKLPASRVGWAAPAYWGADPQVDAPRELGPGAVVYGAFTDLTSSFRGVALGELRWPPR